MFVTLHRHRHIRNSLDFTSKEDRIYIGLCHEKSVQAEPQKWNFVEQNATETETEKGKSNDQGD